MLTKAPNSTKIGETVSFDGDQMVIKKTFDGSHMLRDAAPAREVTENSFGSDYKHVGNVDMGLLGLWLKEAGVAWTDTEGTKEVIKRKLCSSEFSALRVWNGAY